ncbi:MAG TPA: DUF5676 family membrane protein [Burkholderiaceae bacterium]|jgi:hypothetical protein|nr:DUF5676 family membrane protein [Burkholderiaceae bacterium]
MKPLFAGCALALTVMVFYALCTLVAVVWPEPFLGFMQALFHGLDFRPMAVAQPYTFGAFFYAVAVMGVWGFCAGAFFAWVQEAITALRPRA